MNDHANTLREWLVSPPAKHAIWSRAPAHVIAALDELVAQNERRGAALQFIADRRKRWDHADDEHPFDIVTEFWEAVAAADAVLAVGDAPKEKP